MNNRFYWLACILIAAPAWGQANRPGASRNVAPGAARSLDRGAPGSAHTLPRPRQDIRPLPTQPLPPLENISPHPPPVGVGGDFPALPPDPRSGDMEPLPPLEQELWLHGGSYLYSPEGDQLGWPAHGSHEHYQVLRLPEDWEAPQPLTALEDFLGTGPIHPRPNLHWPGHGYRWEPRFVGYGSYQVFAFAFDQNNQRRDAVGHQLIAELDLRLTGTERFHVQFRPLGINATGGSYYQFSNPAGYVDNSVAAPQRYWFEGELHSMLGGFLDPFAVWDYHLLGGKYPLQLQNALLINDEILGFAVNKNNIYLGPLSNINVQLFAGISDVNAFADSDSSLLGTDITIDYKHQFYELTYAFVYNDASAHATRNSHYLAMSRTSWHGTLSLTGRVLLKMGESRATQSGELLVLESNLTRVFEKNVLGVEKGVFYANAFLATSGWRPISSAGFNRLTAAFEVNPLTQIAAGNSFGENWGAVLGTQLFRLHEDESWVPEVAFQSPQNQPVFGVGLRYLRKTGVRSFFEVFGTLNFSKDARFRRRGVFAAQSIVF